MVRATLVALLLIPLAAGQAPFIGTDSLDDVQFATYTVGTNYETTPAVGYEHVDIVDIAVGAETDETFEVAVTFAAEPDIDTGLDFRVPELRFHHEGADYLVAFGDCEGATLSLLNSGSGRYDPLSCIEGGQEGTRLWATVPKALVRDVTGVPSTFGSTLDGFQAERWELVAPSPVGVGTTFAVDFAPDEGVFEQAFTFALGEGGLGDLRWAVPNAIRASNGGPDTFLYGIHLRNEGPAARLAVSIVDAPPQWSVRAAPIIDVPTQGERVLPIAVTTQTAHAHGGTDTFRVELAHADDPETKGFVELGIHYLEIPQLAGHHPELFVHAATYQFPYAGVVPADRTVAWMNTVRDAPGAEPILIAANGGAGQGGANAAGTAWYTEWEFPMDPELLIGMDFDVDAVATLDAGFQVDDELPGELTLAAILWHCNPLDAAGDAGAPSLPCPGGDWHRLADGIAAPVAMGLSGQLDIQVVMTPDAYADLVPYVDGSNVALQLVMGRDVGTLDSDRSYPEMDPFRTSLRLPLNEYRDPLDESFSQVGTLGLHALSPFEKKANPGQSVWFEFDVRNGGAPRDVSLSVFGHHVEWASASSDRMRVDESQRVAVRIDVPEDTPPGDFAEVFLLVEDTVDASQAAMSKMRVVAAAEPRPEETEPDLPDAARNDAPGLPGMVVVGALVLAALRRRA